MSNKDTMSNAVVEELARFGIHASDIANLLRGKAEQRMNQLGLTVKIPLNEPFDVFLSNFRRRNRQGNRTSELSVMTYAQILGQLKQFCIKSQEKEDAEVGILDTSALVRYCRDFLKYIDKTKGFTDTTYNKYVSVVRSFLLNISDHYAVATPSLPKISKSFNPLPQALPEYEVPNLLNAARASRYGIRSHFMISMFLMLGQRRNEFLNVKVRDIDFELQRVTVLGKGNKLRYVFIPDPLVPVIISYIDVYQLEPESFIYPSLQNPKKPTSQQALDKQVLYLLQKLPTYKKGDPVRGYHLHSLRHTYATTLHYHGVDLSTVREALGHAHVTTTEVYTKLDTERLRNKLQPGLEKMQSWWGE